MVRYPARSPGKGSLLSGAGLFRLAATALLGCATAIEPAHVPQGFTRAVIVVHGIRRNADEYLEDLRKALGNSTDGVLPIAPRFSSTADVKPEGLPPDVLTWSEGDWPDGDAAGLHCSMPGLLAHRCARRATAAHQVGGAGLLGHLAPGNARMSRLYSAP